MRLITTMNLSAIDANLFLVLHAVLEERSATKAARRLHVTQSAVSNALARLRRQLGDPLVVRHRRGLVPTPRAEELAPRLREVAAHLTHALDRSGFVPEESTRTFTIGLSDYHQVCDAPRIAEAFAASLPRATLRIVSPDYLIATDGLAKGAVDVAFAPLQAVEPGHRSSVLFEEQGAVVVRRDHPRGRRALSRDAFNALSHIDVHVALGDPGVGHRVATRQWETARVRRRVALTVPHFLTAALAASRTDWAATIPARLASICCQWFPVKTVRTAFPLPRLTTAMVWHERTDTDQAAQYFRELVKRAVSVS